mmetsp:Transcript_24772/g.51469  ORF Transcript_24772/g.51469 Transcript_24772/m.51469 type:complete len:323 (-) Transcript_24772:77-1045(-)
MCRRRTGSRSWSSLIASRQSRSRSRQGHRREPKTSGHPTLQGGNSSPEGVAAPCDAVGAREKCQPFLCIVLGGPGSGKTSLGSGLHRSLPHLCHVSCGDIARLATTAEAQRSPLLHSIGKQLAERRRRKLAFQRLLDVITTVLADGLQSNPSLGGLIADGVRATDLGRLGTAFACHVACVIRISCSRETMLGRLQDRRGRDGDDKLGLADGMDDEGRIDAYLQRVGDEELALREHLATRYESVVHVIDGTQSPSECLKAAEDAVHAAAQHGGPLPDSKAAAPALHIDWAKQLAITAGRLDKERHPDGRPRVRQDGTGPVGTV